MRKRRATSSLSEPTVKRTCLEYFVNSPVPSLQQGDKKSWSPVESVLDLLPIEVLFRIVDCLIPKDGLDDNDFSSLCLVDKKRFQQLHYSCVQPTERTTLSQILSTGIDYNAQRYKLCLYSKEHEMPPKSTPLAIALIDVFSALPNLVHLNIDIYMPNYKKIIPLLSSKLESLHLSSWNEFDVEYARNLLLFEKSIAPKPLITGHTFDHLTSLKRLSLFSSYRPFGLLEISCSEMMLPAGLETLHMPHRLLHVQKDISIPRIHSLKGWSNIKTLGVSSIEGNGLAFCLPILKTLICYTKFNPPCRGLKLDTIVASFDAFSDDPTYTHGDHVSAMHMVIPTQEDFDRVCQVVSDKVQLPGSLVFNKPFRGNLLPINVCQPTSNTPWLPAY